MECYEIQIREIGSRASHVFGVAILFEKQTRQPLMNADVFDAMLTQGLIERISLLLIIHPPPAHIRPRRIKFQTVDLERLALIDERLDRRLTIGRVNSAEHFDASRSHRADHRGLARRKQIDAVECRSHAKAIEKSDVGFAL